MPRLNAVNREYYGEGGYLILEGRHGHYRQHRYVISIIFFCGWVRVLVESDYTAKPVLVSNITTYQHLLQSPCPLVLLLLVDSLWRCTSGERSWRT